MDKVEQGERVYLDGVGNFYQIGEKFYPNKKAKKYLFKKNLVEKDFFDKVDYLDINEFEAIFNGDELLLKKILNRKKNKNFIS